MSSKNARTAGCADTCDASAEISGMRIASDTSSFSKYMRCTPAASYAMRMCIPGSSGETLASSLQSAPA